MQIENNLIGERIEITNYQKSDYSFVTDMWFDEENGKYMSDPTREYVNEEYQKALDHLQDSLEGYYFVMKLKASGELIGTCCVFPDEHKEVFDIGYCIHKSYWRQGYGAETVMLLEKWIRKQGGKAVTAEAAKENTASNRLLQKCGFESVREAQFKKYNMDIVFDSYIYQKTL